MNKTLIIGANGQIGRILIAQLSELALPTIAMVRSPDNAPFPDNIETVEANLEGDIVAAMQGCNQVVFTAGSGAKTGADKTLLVDLWGACKAVDVAVKNKIQHFVMVSARNADNPDEGLEKLKPYLVAKHFADKHLMASGLNYTILRPGRLTNEAGTGLISTTRPVERANQCIPREDVASVITHCLRHQTSVTNKIYELYQGSEAVQSAIA